MSIPPIQKKMSSSEEETPPPLSNAAQKFSIVKPLSNAADSEFLKELQTAFQKNKPTTVEQLMGNNPHLKEVFRKEFIRLDPDLFTRFLQGAAKKGCINVMELCLEVSNDEKKVL